MLELKPLSYFIAAYEEKSISAAAIRCFIAQPSISHAIKSLEDKLQQPLFIRSKAGVMPTEFAHRLYGQSKALIAHSEKIEQQFNGKPSININVYFQGDIGLTSVAPLLQALQQTGLVVLHRVEQLAQSDVALIDREQVGKRFEAVSLYHESFSVLMPNHHPLASKKNLQLQDLHNQPFIERPYCSQRKEFSKRLTDSQTELTITAKADNDIQVMELVALGFGLAGIPSQRVYALPDNVVAKPIALDFKREVVLAHRISRKDISALLAGLNWDWLHQQIKIIQHG